MPHPKPTDFDMTQHSDYFIWKYTSERVARRCDDTVDKKRVNSCVLKQLFSEGVEQPKILPKKPGNALSDALLISRFQNFAADAAKKQQPSARFFKTALRAVSIYSLIRINSGPNILRSCFIHCQLMLSHRPFTRSDVSFETQYSGCLVTVKLTLHTYTPLRETLWFFKAVCSPPSRSRRVTRIMFIKALLLNGFGSNCNEVMSRQWCCTDCRCSEVWGGTQQHLENKTEFMKGHVPLDRLLFPESPAVTPPESPLWLPLLQCLMTNAHTTCVPDVQAEYPPKSRASYNTVAHGTKWEIPHNPSHRDVNENTQKFSI